MQKSVKYDFHKILLNPNILAEVYEVDLCLCLNHLLVAFCSCHLNISFTHSVAFLSTLALL